jgi:hypothetical protein
VDRCAGHGPREHTHPEGGGMIREFREFLPAGIDPEPEAVPEDVVLLGEIRDLLCEGRA